MVLLSKFVVFLCLSKKTKKNPKHKKKWYFCGFYAQKPFFVEVCEGIPSTSVMDNSNNRGIIAVLCLDR